MRPRYTNRNLGAFFAKGDGNILACQLCNTRYCLDCEATVHEGQTCGEFQTMHRKYSEDEEESLAFVKKTSRPCPGKGCGVNIHKISGYDHMTCNNVTCQIKMFGEKFALLTF